MRPASPRSLRPALRGALRLTALAVAAGALLAPVAPCAAAAASARTGPTVATAPVAAPRVALVIGNNAYVDAPLLNPVNDARGMAHALGLAGFAVTLRTDASLSEMRHALRDFGEALRGGGTGVFYFAGHGMQIKGRNYLVPVGTDIRREDEVAYQALDAQAVLDKMESAGNGTNLVILDACRNNPFARSFRSASQGLAQMDAPVGTLVAFATAPGSIASDGVGQHGLYTGHLLDALRQPGLKVEDVFKQVRTAVRRASQGKQVPWESTSLEGDFYFTVPATAPAAPPAAALAPMLPPPDPLAALDEAMWQVVDGSGEPAALQAYLRRFPQGRHAAAARAQIGALSPATTPATTAAAPASPTAPLPAQTAVAPTIAVVAPSVAAALPTGVIAVAPSTPLAASVASAALPALPASPSAATVDSVPDLFAMAVPRQAIGRNDIAPPDAADDPLVPLRELARWGIADLPARPAGPRRNTLGLAEGDRLRWRVIDRFRANTELRREFWQIGAVQADGRLSAWPHAQPIAPAGQPLNAALGDAVEAVWSAAPLPAPTGLGLGERREFAVDRVLRGGHGGREAFSGSLQFVRNERVQLPAGSFDAQRVEVVLRGEARGDRGGLRLLITGWYAPTLGLYVAWDQDLRSTEQVQSRLRWELMALELAGVGAGTTSIAGR